MKISDALLPEFDQEMGHTRKTLERIPEDKLAWKPHDKSMTLGRLAGHVAELPGFATTTIQTDSLNFSMGEFKPLIATSRRQVLEAFDQKAAEARAAIAGASDEHLMKTWSLEYGGKTLFTLPRVAVLRSMMLNHIIHHRAQLGVYLRLNNVPVPSIYGPSADEGGM
ncbi:MAG: DinB family protein [Acidobacteria bacterium]|nr:DinB family protein [Acidobacteriota bacterium]